MKKITFLIQACTCAWLALAVPGGALAAEVVVGPQLLERLEQPAGAVGSQEVHVYYLRNWLTASSSEQLRFIKAAVPHHDAGIAQYGMIAAERFALMHQQRPDMLQSLPREQIRELATQATDPIVRKQGVRAWYMIVHREDKAHQDELARMLDLELALRSDRERDESPAVTIANPSPAVEIIKLMQVDGMNSNEAMSVRRAAERPVSRISYHAVFCLALRGIVDLGVVELVFKHLESDAYFADANLLRMVPKLGPLEPGYFERLENLRLRLIKVIETPSNKRSVSLYSGDQDTLDLLQTVTAQAMQSSGRSAR